MTHRGRAFLLALLIIMLMAPALFAPGSAAAQGPATVIENAELRLWPEYDDPGLLVILSGNFPEGTTYPLTLSIPAPAGARNIQATYTGEAGDLLTRPFEVQGGNLTYEIPSGAFHVEYYLDREPSGDERQINYAFIAPYAINSLRIAVQQPARSTDFSLTPAAETQEQGTDGLTYHIVNQTNVAAGDTLDIAVRYTKTDTGLTAPRLAVTTNGAAQAAPTTAPAPASATDWLPWVLIGLGVALMVGILVYWLLSRRQPAPIEEPARPSRATGATPGARRPLPTVPARPAAGPAVFCHNCGNALKTADRFCPQCGTARRS